LQRKVSVISYRNLFCARKLRPEAQSEARLDDKVLVVHVAAEVVCLKMWLKRRKCVVVTDFKLVVQLEATKSNEVSVQGTGKQIHVGRTQSSQQCTRL